MPKIKTEKILHHSQKFHSGVKWKKKVNKMDKSTNHVSNKGLICRIYKPSKLKKNKLMSKGFEQTLHGK